ncbi:MAG: hypothetical protein SF097_23395 [Acidobacteriota bacterium]|nr:hypothetical protein [Acidobacteriota bacterium]
MGSLEVEREAGKGEASEMETRRDSPGKAEKNKTMTMKAGSFIFK